MIPFSGSASGIRAPRVVRYSVVFVERSWLVLYSPGMQTNLIINAVS